MASEFYSTNNPDLVVPLSEAVLRPLPADNGLYMPVDLAPLPDSFWASWRAMDFQTMAAEVVAHFLDGALPKDVCESIVRDAINFPAPIVELEAGLGVLELFHGPTLAFKDFGARFMARTMAHLTRDDAQPLTILVATSGDTGGAVASAFHNVPGTRVIILYPEGKVSGFQEKQLTTLGGNITALEVDGTFDDCQRLVKSAFLNGELRGKLTSANSINISRLIPQMLYYFETIRTQGDGVVFSIPSGNFGNLTACLLASQLGLEIGTIIAATNANDVVPSYLESGSYQPRPSTATISNAMDVGAPSNFARMQDIFAESHAEMVDKITGMSFSDEETRAAVREVERKFGYQIDPHGAVAYLAAQAWRDTHKDDDVVLLETAHPSKFIDVMDEELGAGKVTIPADHQAIMTMEKISTRISADEESFLTWLKESV
ncbi:MAG: threonine synthase [Akkermansiaceae bacterium]